MWKTQRRTIRENWGETLRLSHDGRVLTVADVIAGWRDDVVFRDVFIAELAATFFPAFFWEMPRLTRATLCDSFECAVIRGDALARMRADDADFAQHLRGQEPVATFLNLGGDALLIAPRRMSDDDCYGHIAAFVRSGPDPQRHVLLQVLARETEKMLERTSSCFWISTSGLGVPWVHVRLDSCPKYYQYRRYAEGR